MLGLPWVIKRRALLKFAGLKNADFLVAHYGAILLYYLQSKVRWFKKKNRLSHDAPVYYGA